MSKSKKKRKHFVACDKHSSGIQEKCSGQTERNWCIGVDRLFEWPPFKCRNTQERSTERSRCGHEACESMQIFNLMVHPNTIIKLICERANELPPDNFHLSTLNAVAVRFAFTTPSLSVRFDSFHLLWRSVWHSPACAALMRRYAFSFIEYLHSDRTPVRGDTCALCVRIAKSNDDACVTYYFHARCSYDERQKAQRRKKSRARQPGSD